jgi:hypothetical protein
MHATVDIRVYVDYKTPAVPIDLTVDARVLAEYMIVELSKKVAAK